MLGVINEIICNKFDEFFSGLVIDSGTNLSNWTMQPDFPAFASHTEPKPISKPFNYLLNVTYTGYRTCPTIRELKGYIGKFVSAAGAASPRVSCHTIRFRWKTKSKHDWISTRSATLQIQCISSFFGKVLGGGSKIKRENMLAKKSRSPPVTHLQYEIVMVCLVNTAQFKQYTFSEQIHRQT